MNPEATAPEPPTTTARAAAGSGPAGFRFPDAFGAPILVLIPLGWLWFRLIDHLRVEWTVNTQYNFGWAIPFLCVYLVWNRWGAARNLHNPTSAGTDAPDCGAGTPASEVPSGGGKVPLSSLIAVALLALSYLPVRLVEEANPEWRFVSWALALIVIGITWFTLSHFSTPLPYPPTASGTGLAGASGTGTPASPVRATFPLSRLLAFPLLFFLVAVPWPTLVEGPLIQGLTRANAAVTIEILNAIGIPAIQHGNLIEVGSGVVGIDEACSGIRSFQATLMLSLFFGEIYGLTALRRMTCVLAGFAFSFLFNVSRTTVLTMVAARKGTDAIMQWHDPAGITILVACFVCLWGLAVFLSRKATASKAESHQEAAPRAHGFTPPGFQSLKTSWSSNLGLLLLAWLLLAELGTEAWYRVHEQRLAAAPAWSVNLPRSNPTYRDLPLTDKTRQFLRYDEAQNGAWEEPNGARIQAIYLRWNAGRIAVHLARSHTPDICLPAAGREVVDRTQQRLVSVHGLDLPFRAYTVREPQGVLHVYYCLWEDRANVQEFQATSLTYGNRLGPVLAGRRNSGQRSLELIIRGPAEEPVTERVLREQLERIVAP